MAAADREPLALLAEAPPGPAPGSLRRAALLVAPAMAAANGLNYAFNVVMSRELGPADYGALGALLAVVLVGTVPGVALQAVVARHTGLKRPAHYREVRRDRRRGSRGLGNAQASLARDGATAGLWSAVVIAVLGVGAALGLLAAIASPGLRAFIHLDSLAPCLWLAVALLPLPLLSAVHGMLQGREWFGALAAVLLVDAAGRLVVGFGLVHGGLGVAGALAGSAAGSVAAILVALPRLRGRLARGWRRRRALGVAGAREVVTAAVGILGLLLLANVDVLLARHYLAREASGLYAAGAMLTKIAYWAPQFVVTVVFARLVVTADRRRLLARSAAAVAALCATLVLGSALAPELVARLSFGQAYLGVGPALPLFAALGTGLALAQLVLFSGLAAADRRMHLLPLAAVAAETALVVFVLHRSVVQVVGAALAVVAALLAVGFALTAGVPGRHARQLRAEATP
jgi:O-antigen/teichoic acid export membrane protein